MSVLTHPEDHVPYLQGKTKELSLTEESTS